MKKLGITIICAILFTCFVILLKGNYENLLLKNANYGLPHLIKQGSIENLFIGSSMFRQGLDAKILEEKNIDSFILSYNGNNPILELWQLNYLLKNNVKIKNLYIDMYAYSLTTNPSISDSKILMEVDLKGKYQLYRLLNEKENLSDFYSIFVSKNTELILSWPIYYKLVNQTFYKGGITSGKDGIDENKLNSLEMIEEQEINFQNIEAIKEIIKICKENNIHLFYIETPKSKRIVENKNYQNLMNTYKNLLKEQEITYYLAQEINPTISNDSFHFFDLIHLSNSGREKYTTSLADKMKTNELTKHTKIRS